MNSDKIDKLSELLTDLNISVVRLETRVMSDMVRHKESLLEVGRKVSQMEDRYVQMGEIMSKLVHRIEALEGDLMDSLKETEELTTDIEELQKHVTRADGAIKAMGLITALGATLAVLKGWFTS